MDENPTTDGTVAAETIEQGELTASDLIEEVLIDGMCGVY